MNSENSKTSDLHRLGLNITDNIDLWGGEKRVVLSDQSIYYTWKNMKKPCGNKNIKI